MEQQKNCKNELENRKEIIERMKKIIEVENDVDLAKYFDSMTEKQARQAINHFKRLGSPSFYAKIIEFGRKHNACVNWIYSGKGEKHCKSVLPTAEEVSEPGILFHTSEDQKYVDMVLDVLRNADEQDRKSLMRSIELFYEHYKRREGDIKKAQDC